MKILHISTADKSGGAAIAALRLNNAMLASGLYSKLLVKKKDSSQGSVISVSKNGKRTKLKDFFLSIWNYLLNKYLLKPSYIYSFSNWGIHISHLSELKEADVIYIHWVNNFLSIKEISKILNLGKPVFFFMHDMWHITGGCHYSFECNLYESRCKNCPLLRGRFFDSASYIFKRKEKLLKSNSNLYYITPSRWLEHCVSKSSILGINKVITIPNVLDANIFKEIDSKTARNILNLPQDKQLLLFGADGGTANPYKGWKYLKQALNDLSKKDNIELVIFGNTLSPHESEQIPYFIHSFGKVYDEYSLSLLYNAVDVFITPSLVDNYPNTILESLFCGTPVVAFDVGGIPDLVKHQVTGYLAKTKDARDLALGIEWSLKQINNKEFMYVFKQFINKNLCMERRLIQHLELIENILK